MLCSFNNMNNLSNFQKNNVRFKAALPHPERVNTLATLRTLPLDRMKNVCNSLNINPENITLEPDKSEFAVNLAIHCKNRELDTQLRDAVNKEIAKA